jgi:hypothetical protein
MSMVQIKAFETRVLALVKAHVMRQFFAEAQRIESPWLRREGE